MSIQQCQRMVRDLASAKRRTIGEDDFTPIAKLPKHLKVALERLKELRAETAVYEGRLALAGYEDYANGGSIRLTFAEREKRVKPRQAKISSLTTAAILELMKCDTPKARALAVEKFNLQLAKV